MPNTETIRRVQRMELYFNTLQAAFETDPALLREDPPLAAMLAALTDYYNGPLWRADFAADERGELPGGLRRGVLSEDGVYNFLAKVEA